MHSPSSEPFFFAGGPTGVLLIHGFGGSPAETRGLGEHLAAQGHSVLGVRLAGHGGEQTAFFASRWTEWADSVDVGYAQLRASCPSIVVAGFSLGGLLGLLLARRRPVRGLITMGSRVLLGRSPRFLVAPVLRHLVGWREPWFGANAELGAVVRRGRSALPLVQVPALVMHGRDDAIVPLANAETIVRELGSITKELVWWEQTGHQMLVEGPHREAIYGRIAAFVAAHA